MGLQKVAFNFMVERGGKLCKSLLFCAKPQKVIPNIKNIKYDSKLNNVVPFVTKLEKNIEIFKKDNLLQFIAKENPKLRKYLNKSEEELLYSIREQKYTAVEQDEIRKLFYDIKSSWPEYLRRNEGVDPLNTTKELLDKYGEIGNSARAKFVSVFDDIIFPKSTNPKVIDIENKLAELGIDARLTDHEKISQNIYTAFKNMHQKGVREFPKVRYTLEDEMNEAIVNKALKDRYVIYSDDIFKIVQEEKGYLANPTIDGIIYHEVGHTLNNVGAGSTLIGDTSKYQKIAKDIQIPENVSLYSYSLDEFMAEYFSGIMGGKIYPKNINKFYLVNNGYIPPIL